MTQLPKGADVAVDPCSTSFRPSTHQGRGKETVRCDPAIPPGRPLLEIESYHSISTTIESCDTYGRAEDFLLMAYEDDVRARTVALVPPDRPLTLRVEADTPWTLRVLPLAHARRFDSSATRARVRRRGPGAPRQRDRRGPCQRARARPRAAADQRRRTLEMCRATLRHGVEGWAKRHETEELTGCLAQT